MSSRGKSLFARLVERFGPRCLNCGHDATIHYGGKCLGAVYDHGVHVRWCDCTTLHRKEKGRG